MLSPPSPPQSLGQGKPAAQSSTANDTTSGLPLPAALALDASTATCSQTLGEPAGPWW